MCRTDNRLSTFCSYFYKATSNQQRNIINKLPKLPKSYPSYCGISLTSGPGGQPRMAFTANLQKVGVPVGDPKIPRAAWESRRARGKGGMAQFPLGNTHYTAVVAWQLILSVRKSMKITTTKNHENQKNMIDRIEYDRICCWDTWGQHPGVMPEVPPSETAHLPTWEWCRCLQNVQRVSLLVWGTLNIIFCTLHTLWVLFAWQ